MKKKSKSLFAGILVGLLFFLMLPIQSIEVAAEVIQSGYKTIIGPNLVYEEVYGFVAGLSRVKNANGKYGMIDMTGREVVPCTYDWVAEKVKNESIIVEKDGKYGVLNIDGTNKVLIQYDYANIVENKYIEVIKEGKYGWFDCEGNVIVPCKYQDIYEVDGQYIVAKEAYNYNIGVYDQKGRVIVPSTCKSVMYLEDLKNSFIVVDENSNAYMIDKNGNRKYTYGKFNSIKRSDSEGTFRGVREIDGIGTVDVIMTYEGKFKSASYDFEEYRNEEVVKNGEYCSVTDSNRFIVFDSWLNKIAEYDADDAKLYDSELVVTYNYLWNEEECCTEVKVGVYNLEKKLIINNNQSGVEDIKIVHNGNKMLVKYNNGSYKVLDVDGSVIHTFEEYESIQYLNETQYDNNEYKGLCLAKEEENFLIIDLCGTVRTRLSEYTRVEKENGFIYAESLDNSSYALTYDGNVITKFLNYGPHHTVERQENSFIIKESYGNAIYYVKDNVLANKKEDFNQIIVDVDSLGFGCYLIETEGYAQGAASGFLITSQGIVTEVVVSNANDYTITSENDCYLLKDIQNSIYYVLSQEGDLIFKTDAYVDMIYDKGLWLVYKGEKKYYDEDSYYWERYKGYLDAHGNEIIECGKYSGLNILKNKITNEIYGILAQNNTGYYLLDTNGDIKTAYEYRGMSAYQEDDKLYLRGNKDGWTYIIELDGTVVERIDSIGGNDEPVDDTRISIENGYYMVGFGTKSIIVYDNEGQKIKPYYMGEDGIEYSDCIGFCFNSLIPLRINGKWGVYRIPASATCLKHTAIVIKGKKATTTINGLSDGQMCSICGEMLVEQKTVAKISDIEVASMAYNGEYQAAKIVIKDSMGKAISSSNYTLTGTTKAINVGLYQVKITFKGNYSGNKTLTWKITPQAIKSPKVTVSSQTYTGKGHTVKLSIKDSQGKTISSKYYTVTGTKSATSAGTYKVKLTFKGNYSGSKTLTWKINPQAIKSPTVTVHAKTYTCKYQTVKLSVKDNKGKTISSKYYTISGTTKAKKVGTYKAKITFKGNYSGSKTITWRINPKSTSISKLTKGSKKIAVKWKKQATQTKGYQIQYSTSKSFKSGVKTVTIKNAKTTSKTIAKLKAKTTYYVRIRTYNESCYSNWSTVKSVKTK